MIHGGSDASCTKNSRRPSMNTGKDDVLRGLFASQVFVASFLHSIIYSVLDSPCVVAIVSFWFLWLVYRCLVVRTLLHQYSLLLWPPLIHGNREAEVQIRPSV